MAVDGRKIRQSLYKGSDIEHDFPCSTCTKEGKNVAAIKHCVECDENLCQKCLCDHNKFSVMRGHQLLDTVKQPSEKKQELPRQRCEKHGGKLIDVYCAGHDKVGCSTCMTVEHRSCRDITFVPDVACKTDTTQALKLLETEINTLESRFMALKQKKVKELDNAKKEKSQMIKEIESERKNINDRLDKMEMELLQEVDATFQIKLRHIESNMKIFDARIVVLQESLQKIHAAKHENESEKYVQIKRVREIYKNTSCLEGFEGSSKTGTLRFDPFRQGTDLDCNTIGSILHLPDIEVEKCTEFNLQIEGDKESCWITDMCMCEDSCIVMSDYKNKRIKKINESFQVVYSLNVTDNPVGICQVGKSLLAVTLINDRKVQFISQKDTMELQQSFEVGDRCRDIAYNDGMIYVCCGGSEERKEGVGHLEVYSFTGTLLKSYYGEIKYPLRVVFLRSSVEMFVTDNDKGILLIDETGDMTNFNVDNKVFSDAEGICKINKSLFCVAFYNSHNVLLMSYDGKDQVELLAGNNGLTNPWGLCFDYKRSRLLVSCENSDKIMVYTLKITD